jgi:predicted metal-binding membrane protein
MLMALLFVGGIMNLAWIAVLTLLVALEKLLRWGRAMSVLAGAGCILLGWAILLG